jgi:hypothetical protein
MAGYLSEMHSHIFSSSKKVQRVTFLCECEREDINILDEEKEKKRGP